MAARSDRDARPSRTARRGCLIAATDVADLPPAVTAAAHAALRAAGLTLPARVDLVDQGADHWVVLTPSSAVRVARHEMARRDLQRRQALVDALPPLPFAVPRSLGPVVTEEHAAVATTLVPGAAHPPGSGDPATLAALLEALWAVDVDRLRPLLAAPMSFAGGPRWPAVMREQLLPLLPPALRPEAERRITVREQLQHTTDVLGHGDLAGHNVHWRDGRVLGVLDWDLAAAADPALDVAGLATWHGWSAVDAAVADQAVRARARVHRSTFELEIAAHALIAGDPDPARLARALEQASTALSTPVDAA